MGQDSGAVEIYEPLEARQFRNFLDHCRGLLTSQVAIRYRSEDETFDAQDTTVFVMVHSEENDFTAKIEAHQKANENGATHQNVSLEWFNKTTRFGGLICFSGKPGGRNEARAYIKRLTPSEAAEFDISGSDLHDFSLGSLELRWRLRDDTVVPDSLENVLVLLELAQKSKPDRALTELTFEKTLALANHELIQVPIERLS